MALLLLAMFHNTWRASEMSFRVSYIWYGYIRSSGTQASRQVTDQPQWILLKANNGSWAAMDALTLMLD